MSFSSTSVISLYFQTLEVKAHYGLGTQVHATRIFEVFYTKHLLIRRSIIIQMTHRMRVSYVPRQQSSWGQHGAHLGPVGPIWAPCWPHQLCYQGCDKPFGSVGLEIFIAAFPFWTKPAWLGYYVINTLKPKWSLFYRQCLMHFYLKNPDSNVHVANMGPIWGRQDPGGPHLGPMNTAIREALLI